MAAVMVTCRPVSSRRMASPELVGAFALGCRLRATVLRFGGLVQHLPLVRCGNFELLAVLRNGTACQFEALALQDADDLRVAQRLSRILLLDDLADALLDRDRRHRLAVRAA